MKIVHVPFCYWPDPIGGTEVYVRSLAKQQQRQGLDVMVAAPAPEARRYVHDGLTVRRFPISEVRDLRDLYGEGDPAGAAAFGDIVDDERPHVVHIHAFTSGVSLRLVREVRRRGVPIVFSYHTPTVSCPRGTLLRWGREVCDGLLGTVDCARCTLHGHGLSKPLSVLTSLVPNCVGRILGDADLSGGVWTAVRMPELVEIRHNSFRNLMAEVDHVVALSQWVKNVLLANGVPDLKITLSRQGLDDVPCAPAKRRPLKLPIRIALLGRLDPTKGQDILIRAVRAHPELPVVLDLFGVIQDEAGNKYRETLASLAAGDARVHLERPIAADEVIERLSAYDLLAVPSQWLETGPRVVLEAFAAGVPVLGSRLGGIAELVEHGANGLLVDARSISAWAGALMAVTQDLHLLERLRSGVPRPRSMSLVARAMTDVYEPLATRRIQPQSFLESSCLS